MFKRKRNAFTLIELIATLVIMAIIAFIVTPLVMTIIRHAKLSADKRSVDAYGRSIELAIASHLLDTGKFATSIDELTIEYSGNKVECETIQINPDSSVYLSNCKVNNREVTNYTYGTDKSPSYESYQVGDHVSYNGVNYYVIEDSDTKNNVVKLIKEEPLLKNEIDSLGLDGINVLESRYGYGRVIFGENNSYNSSIVKKIVDVWSKNKILPSELKKSRLININDLVYNLGYVSDQQATDSRYIKTENTPGWFAKYFEVQIWTESQFEDTLNKAYCVTKDNVSGIGVYSESAIRPVVELYKTATITKLES